MSVSITWNFCTAPASSIRFPKTIASRLDGAPQARAAGLRSIPCTQHGGIVVGMSPGAAYGTAKRWLPERFAEAANNVASKLGAPLPSSVPRRARIVQQDRRRDRHSPVHNFAGETTLPIHRFSRGLPCVFDQRFRRDARSLRARRSHRSYLRSHRRFGTGPTGPWRAWCAIPSIAALVCGANAPSTIAA